MVGHENKSIMQTLLSYYQEGDNKEDWCGQSDQRQSFQIVPATNPKYIMHDL